MSTKIRPEVSEKNEYYLERHRYYELKHFCLQYPLWKKEYSSISGMSNGTMRLSGVTRTNSISDPTSDSAERMIFYSDRMKLVEQAAISTESDLYEYILLGVVEGLSYDCLRVNYNIPCCKDVYYNLYRKFFWILDKSRR